MAGGDNGVLSLKTLQQSENPKTNVGHWRKESTIFRKLFSGPEDPYEKLLAVADSKCITEALRHKSKGLQWTQRHSTSLHVDDSDRTRTMSRLLL